MVRTIGLSLLVALAAPQLLHAQAAAPDSAAIRAGKQLFEGRGLCATCHGKNGEGVLGPTLRLNAGKAEWLHSDGSLAGIVKVITGGVDAAVSKGGLAMPPKGGARLTDAQIEQVAAYVQVLHRTPAERP